MNPEGIQSSSPGLAFFSQPWGTAEPREPTPTGLRRRRFEQDPKPTQPFSGLRIDFFISPGLAEKRQPWTGGQNPFGIYTAIEFCKMPW
jgi:hypothetical protein